MLRGATAVLVSRFGSSLELLSLRRSERPNQSDTSNPMIPVPLLNPKFAKVFR
jgi:hypothetical protein